MNVIANYIIYPYIKGKCVEKIIDYVYAGSIQFITTKAYNLVIDPLWNTEIQKYYFGDCYVQITNNDSDLKVISCEEIDEKINNEKDLITINKKEECEEEYEEECKEEENNE